MTRKAVAVILCVTVWNLCAVAGFAREIGIPPGGAQVSPLARLLAAAPSRVGGTNLSPAPLAVSGSMGQVAWKSLPGSAAGWACRTGSGSVSLDLKEAGRISVMEDSSVDIRAAGDETLVTLLRGSVRVAGSAGAPVRVQTFDGSYVLGEKESYEARFSWRDGALSVAGDSGRRDASPMIGASLAISASEGTTLVNGKPGAVSAIVTDAMGQPLAGVPVVFRARTEGGKVSFGGAPEAVSLSDARGIAAATATALGATRVAIDAAVAGTDAAASAQAGVDRTSGRQKWMAVIILGALAAATVALVVVVRDKDNPKLVTGTPTRVAP